MTLQKHLDYARRRAKVSINLKRRMCVKQVAIHTASARKLFPVNGRQRSLQQRVCSLSVTQARPKINFPRQTPTRTRVAAQFQTLSRCGEQIRSAALSDLITRKQTVEMRDVTMLAFRRFEVPVFEPFL